MDRKTVLEIIDDLLSRLKSDMEQQVSDMPVHWEREEIEWLLVRMAERMTSTRTEAKKLQALDVIQAPVGQPDSTGFRPDSSH